MLFDSWNQVGRVVVMALGAYAVLVVALRVSGKRTLAKLNAFDLVVTVALGSTLATIALSADVSFAEGVTAVVMLVGMQLVVAALAVHFRPVRRVAKSEPTLLLRDGRLLHDVLVAQRVTEGEVRQAIRASGSGGIDDVAAVVLETDGTLSVVTRGRLGVGDALADVRTFPEQRSP